MQKIYTSIQLLLIFVCLNIELNLGADYAKFDISSDCSRLIAVDDEYGGVIYVGGDDEKYGKSLNCTMLVRAYKLPTSQQYSEFKTFVGFKFLRFDVPDKWPWSETCEDYVEIFEEELSTPPLTKSEFNRGVCAKDVDMDHDEDDDVDEDYHYFTTSSDVALVRFVSDIAVEGTGFELSFTSFYKSDGSSCYSENGEFFCKNGNCIAQSLRCDRIDNCGDDTDEKNCEYENDPVDLLKDLLKTIVDNYALVIAILAFSSMLFSVILAFCVRVICREDSKRLRKKKKQNIIIGADGKKIINPNLKAPVYRKNPGL